MSRVVTSLKECPEFNSGNPKLNSGPRSHSGMNIRNSFTLLSVQIRYICSYNFDFSFASSVQIIYGQKQPPEVFHKKRCSVSESLFHCNLLKKRLWHRCFPVNFGKFLGRPFQQNTSGRLLLYAVGKNIIHVKIPIPFLLKTHSF